jgi:hypothetical protein
MFAPLLRTGLCFEQKLKAKVHGLPPGFAEPQTWPAVGFAEGKVQS